MIEDQSDKAKIIKVYNSELLLKILKKALIEDKTYNEKELYVDENWKINAKDSSNTISDKHSELKKILSELFPSQKITITDNKNGSQTILIF